MKKQKIYSTLMIILIILSFASNIFAEENQTNEENSSTNSVKTLSLEEQKNQVQEQLAEANDQLTYVQDELSSKLINIQNLEEKISNYQKQLSDVNAKYDSLQKQVKEAEEKLQTIQSAYNKKDRLLKARLVEIYKHGSNNYLDVLLGSKDIIEFISNYFMIESITKYDMQSLENLKAQKQSIEKITKELNENKANMKITKSNAEKQSVILANTKTILENEKASLDDSEQRILSQIDSYKKQQEEINTLIQNSIVSSNYELRYSGGIMIWPTLSSSYITSQFGSRLHPIQGIIKNHNGIDIGGATGNPIYAAKDGIIIYYGWMSGYGNTVMIDHGTNNEGVKIVSLYGHGSEFIEGLSVGSSVTQGQEIMKIGSTGNSTGPHVHFEVRENGVPVDPKKYLTASENDNNAIVMEVN